jgi:hypothetical protein
MENAGAFDKGFDIGFDKVILNAHGASYLNFVFGAFKYVPPALYFLMHCWCQIKCAGHQSL